MLKMPRKVSILSQSETDKSAFDIAMKIPWAEVVIARQGTFSPECPEGSLGLPGEGFLSDWPVLSNPVLSKA